jgi:hypothetical protein
MWRPWCAEIQSWCSIVLGGGSVEAAVTASADSIVGEVFEPSIFQFLFLFSYFSITKGK